MPSLLAHAEERETIRAVEEAISLLDDLGCADDATTATLHRQAAIHRLSTEEIAWATAYLELALDRRDDIDNPCAYLVGIFQSIAAGHSGPHADRLNEVEWEAR